MDRFPVHGGFAYDQEQPLLWRRDRVPTLTVIGDVAPGTLPETVVDGIADDVAAFAAELPAGYKIELGGIAEESAQSQASVFAEVPLHHEDGFERHRVVL